MCTYILYHDPDSHQPFIMASTRDENPGRPTTPPFRWDNPERLRRHLQNGRLVLHYADGADVSRYTDAGIVAAQDDISGGSFAGFNRHGVMVAINNRRSSIDKTSDRTLRKSRGGLVLDALTFASAKEAAEAAYDIITREQATDARSYPGLNLIIADAREAYAVINAKRNDIDTGRPGSGVIRHETNDTSSVALVRIPSKQVVVFASHDMNDPRSRRGEKFRPMFSGETSGRFGKQVAMPDARDLSSWGEWLAHMTHDLPEGKPGEPLDFADPNNPFNCSITQPHPDAPDARGFGFAHWITVSTSLFALRKNGAAIEPEMAYMEGPQRFGRMEMQCIDKEGKSTHYKVALSPSQCEVRESTRATGTGTQSL